jgi:hypothetical protein
MSSNLRSNGEPSSTSFPILPIVTPDPPKRAASERYGALFYLGITGLVILVGLVGWFGWGVWTHRSVWTNVYVLHDSSRPEAERNQAAYALSRNPQVNARQLWDMALLRNLPPLARYVIAESLPAETAEADPRGYVLAVARSEDWPGWLRALLARPIAYAAAEGHRFPREPLIELARNPDPGVALWAEVALARGGDQEADTRLRHAGASGGAFEPLARQLVNALDATTQADRIKSLDDATRWLRDHHPDAVEVWKGWQVGEGRIVPASASELQ